MFFAIIMAGQKNSEGHADQTYCNYVYFSWKKEKGDELKMSFQV